MYILGEKKKNKGLITKQKNSGDDAKQVEVGTKGESRNCILVSSMFVLGHCSSSREVSLIVVTAL